MGLAIFFMEMVHNMLFFFMHGQDHQLWWCHTCVWVPQCAEGLHFSAFHYKKYKSRSC